MKIFNVKELKRGTGQYGEWIMVGFEDENGQKYSTFAEWMLNVANGAEVPGDVTIKEDGDKKYYNFKPHKDAKAPIQLGSTGPAPVQQRTAQPDDEKWGVKDLQIAYQNANNTAAMLLSGKGAEAVGEFDELQKHIYGKFLGYDFKSDYTGARQAAEATPVADAPNVQEGPEPEIDLSAVPF